MKGGVLKQINEEEFTSWKNPHNFPNDCCPCVFNFLGMPFSEAEKHALANPEGFRKYEIENVFNKAYPDYNFTFKEFARSPQDANAAAIAVGPGREAAKPFINNNMVDTLDMIFKQILPNHGTVGGIGRYFPGQKRERSWHCIIFAKDNNNVSLILDAQEGKIYRDGCQILEHLIRENVVNIYVLEGLNKSTGAPLILAPGKGNVDKVDKDGDVIMDED